MEKIKNIEILRFIFILQIFFMHTINSNKLYLSFPEIDLFQKLHMALGKAYLCVDYFFIIAGFFLVYTFKNISVQEFIKKKLNRLLPEIIISILMLYGLSLIFKTIRIDTNAVVSTLTLTTNLGIFPMTVGYAWFATALFWGLLFYFYCLKHFKQKYNNINFALVVIISYSMLFNHNGGFGNVLPNLYGYINIGLLRALAGIGIGYFIGCWYLNNKNNLKQNVTLLQKFIYTFLEGFTLFYLIYFTSFHKYKYSLMILIYTFVLLFILFLIKKGYISRLLDNNFSVFLGKYVYSLYIMEIVVTIFLKDYLLPCKKAEIANLIALSGGGYGFVRNPFSKAITWSVCISLNTSRKEII